MLTGKRIIITQAHMFMGPALALCFSKHGAKLLTEYNIKDTLMRIEKDKLIEHPPKTITT